MSSLDWRVFLFTALIGAGATLGFGAAPAFAATRADLADAVKGHRSGRARDSRLRSTFLIAQVAMSVLLLVVAGLFIRSAKNATSIDPGFDPVNVVVGSLDLETRGYSEAKGQAFLRTLHDRLNGAGGLAAATLVDIVPVTLSNQTIDLLQESDPQPAHGERSPRPRAYANNVGPGHFRTLRIGLVAGRDFTPCRQRDRASGRHRQRDLRQAVLAGRVRPWDAGSSRTARPIRPASSKSSASSATAST